MISFNSNDQFALSTVNRLVHNIRAEANKYVLSFIKYISWLFNVQHSLILSNIIGRRYSYTNYCVGVANRGYLWPGATQIC